MEEEEVSVSEEEEHDDLRYDTTVSIIFFPLGSYDVFTAAR